MANRVDCRASGNPDGPGFGPDESRRAPPVRPEAARYADSPHADIVEDVDRKAPEGIQESLVRSEDLDCDDTLALMES